MKRLCFGLVCVLTLILTCGCSLDYSELGEEGAFSFAYGKKSAFVTEYRWDGSEEGMTVRIPESYNERKVLSVGGYYGRGLSMPFSVDISAYFPEDTVFLEAGEDVSPAESLELKFTLLLPAYMKESDQHLSGGENSRWLVQKDDKILEYQVVTELSYEE